MQADYAGKVRAQHMPYGVVVLLTNSRYLLGSFTLAAIAHSLVTPCIVHNLINQWQP